MGKKSSKLAQALFTKEVNEASNQIESWKTPELCIVENFVVVWLDANIDQSLQDFQNSINQLRQIVNSIVTYNDEKQCIQFIKKIKDEKVFLIVSGSLGQRIAPIIFALTQLDSVYVFCRQKFIHEQWTKQYQKIKGVFIDIHSICARLKKDIRQTNNDLAPISIIAKSETIASNAIDPIFMYSELIKEIILEMKFDKKDREEFIQLCRLTYQKNSTELEFINKFEQKYRSDKAIQWYTEECFIYAMLNKALRTLDNEIIHQMGFYIRDLHEQIEQIYLKSKYQAPFVVWRGQGIPIQDFEKLKTSTGGFFSFSNFLSTSTDRSVALCFAESAQQNKELRAVLFHIRIDPSISQTPFANVQNISCHQKEEEILFSMHTVFRIDEVAETSNGIWQVNLTSTTDNDPQLKCLTDHLRKENEGGTSLHRLAKLMYKMGEFDKARAIYEQLLKMTANGDRQELAFLHNQLGSIACQNAELESALSHYAESLHLYRTCLSSDNPRISTTYSNIGMIFRRQGKLDEALDHFQRALDIDLKAPHPDQGKIATHYNNIAGVLEAQGKYTEALKMFHDSLKIRRAQYSFVHPSVATVYNNIGGVHCSMRNYSAALSAYQKTLEIRQKCLPPNHPSLAVTHNNIAMTLDDLHHSKEAIEHAKTAVTIAKKNFGSDDPKMQKYQHHLDQLQRKVQMQ